MAHLIDSSRGKAAFVSFRKPAWHGLGEIFNESIDFQTAIKSGQLDYQVVKCPNTHEVPGFGPVVSDNSFFTYRTDTGRVLGDKLGKQYLPIQNEEALNVVEGLIAEGCRIETAGALSHGARAFICIQLPESIRVNGTDEVRQFAVIATGHDGSLGILAYFTNTRVVCNNTLQASFGDAIQKRTIRHTNSAKAKLEEAGKLMKIALNNKETVGKTYQSMADTDMTMQQFFDYVGNVFFSPEEIKEIKNGERAQNVVSSRKLNVVKDVLNFNRTGIGQAEIQGTAWGAYNAITGYFSNVKQYETAEARMDGLLFETGATTMQKAAVLAADPKLIIPLKAAPASGINYN